MSLVESLLEPPGGVPEASFQNPWPGFFFFFSLLLFWGSWRALSNRSTRHFLLVLSTTLAPAR